MSKLKKHPKFYENFLFFFLYASICVVGVVINFHPTLLSGFANIQTDIGDAVLINYFLEHSFHLLTNQDYVGGLWSPAFFYPYPNVLAFSENVLGSAPVYWLFRAFFSSDIAFQLWEITIAIFCFVSFAFLMYRYQVNPALGALGAFLFAFSMPRIAQLGHPQLLPQFFTPLVFLVLWDFFKQPTTKKFILLLLLIYLQVLSSIYLGWFLIFSLLIFFSFVYLLDSETRQKACTYWQCDWKAIIGATVSWLFLMLITLRPYLQARLVFGDRLYSEVDTMLPRINSWFSVPSGSIWSSLLNWTDKDLPMVHEHHMFAGSILILLTALSIYTVLFFKKALSSQKYLLVQVCLLVFVSIFMLSFRMPSGFSLWKIVYEIVPGATAIRAVTRIWTIAYFYLLIAVIVCVDSLLYAKITKKLVRLLIISLFCIISISEQIVFNLPSTTKAPFAGEVVEVAQLMKKNCNLSYTLFDDKKPFYQAQLSAMWAGIKTNIPVINGYSGQFPPNYTNMTQSMNAAQVLNWLDDFDIDAGQKLCLIYPQSLGEKDETINLYNTHKSNNSLENFIVHTIQLPVEKVFGHLITILVDFPQLIKNETSIKLQLLVKNTSNFIWSPTGKRPTNFSYVWVDQNKQLATIYGNRTSLPYELSPGETLVLNATIITPKQPGKYKLILTMVQEYVAWFHDQTDKIIEIPVEITS